MDTKTLIPALAALVIGGVGGYMIADQTPVDHGAMSMDDMMAAMNAELAGKEGNAFDRAFLIEMIAHHQGAVAMAELARENAGHDEIKQMAEAIIEAQNAEIAQMQTWHTAWFAPMSLPAEGMHHSE